MSEEEIANLMAGEMAKDACETVGGDCKARCEAVLRKIIIEGEGFELLNELSEADKRAVKEKLRELVGQTEEKPVVAGQKQLQQQA
ncbi:MAG: hypothetical protein N0A00_05740 [Candidatus Bathyarchaeota archaeon]|nr:hypothetical protein [Candidatus Bathyarchaeota archaeon]